MLRALLAGGQYAIVWVLTRAYAPLVARHRLESPFGLPTSTHHSVVLCSADPFLVLDPFFESGGQPIELTDEEVVACFSGHCLIVPRE